MITISSIDYPLERRLPMNNVLYNIHFMKLCALKLMYHFSGFSFPNVDEKSVPSSEVP